MYFEPCQVVIEHHLSFPICVLEIILNSVTVFRTFWFIGKFGWSYFYFFSLSSTPLLVLLFSGRYNKTNLINPERVEYKDLIKSIYRSHITDPSNIWTKFDTLHILTNLDTIYIDSVHIRSIYKANCIFFPNFQLLPLSQ